MTAVNPDNEATFTECVVKSDLRETCVPKQAIITELERCRYSEDAVFAVQLALEEALANAVKHGNRNDAAKSITVRYAVNEEKAVVVVRDEGGGFLPDDVPDCTSPDRLPLPNGRGIMLIRAYMDEVCYRDRGREVYFVKRRASATPAAVTKRAKNVRRTIYFSGSVQGVGFRYTTCDIASKFRVKGFIRNLPDGRVELVAEGREIDLDRFQCAVEEAMCGHIRDVAATDSAATREFKKFVIAS
jgi:serine/threonine-protein kinase RsbW